MALENAESTSDELARGDGLEQAWDYTGLRVSLNTQLESGIPTSRAREERPLVGGMERLELALVSATHTEANLGLLIRGLEHLATGAQTARDANATLAHELEQMRTDLSRRSEEAQSLGFRVNQLERLLEVVRHEGGRERQFLIEQHDLFLVAILTDHECQVADLRCAVAAGLGRPFEQTHQRQIEELTAQRDQAREYATCCERERDAAWRELAASETTSAPVTVPRYATPAPDRSLTRPGTASPSGETVSGHRDAEPAGSQSKATAIGSISLRALEVPATYVSATHRESGSPVSTASRDRRAEHPATAYSVSGDDIAD